MERRGSPLADTNPLSLGQEIDQCLSRHEREERVTLSRANLDRAIRNMPKLEAVALIRAAYLCTAEAALPVYERILREERR